MWNLYTVKSNRMKLYESKLHIRGIMANKAEKYNLALFNFAHAL